MYRFPVKGSSASTRCSDAKLGHSAPNITPGSGTSYTEQVSLGKMYAVNVSDPRVMVSVADALQVAIYLVAPAWIVWSAKMTLDGSEFL